MDCERSCASNDKSTIERFFNVSRSFANLVAAMSATSLTSTGVLREYLVANQSGFIAKVRYLFPLGGVALPLSLAALAAAGYFYTTHTLFWRLLATCMFVASLVVMRSILYHMLLLRQRYLSMGHAREHAAAAKLAGEGAADLQPVAGIVTENKSETNGE